jgi:hypothetical protein
MRTMTREEAMTAKRQVERASYTTTYVAPYYGTGRIVFGSRTGHCGGTDYDHIGIVDAATADALVSAGAKDRRN